jgi:hypothetical protein
MATVNIFNIVNHLQKCVQINYKNSNSKSNKLEINFAESLFEIIGNYVKSIGDDIENGGLIDFDSNVTMMITMKTWKLLTSKMNWKNLK